MNTSIRLRNLIESRNLRQAEVAKEAGISAQYLNDLISSRRECTFELAVKLAEILGCDLLDIDPMVTVPYSLSRGLYRVVAMRLFLSTDGRNEDRTVLIKETWLPFAPFEGLIIAKLNHSRVREVTWVDECFRIRVQDSTPDQLQFYLDMGWDYAWKN